MAKPSPFPPSTSTPGTGTVRLTLQPPSKPIFSTLFFRYPLKLIVSAPHILPALPSPPSSTTATHSSTPSTPRPSNVPLLFLLSYGGGLVSGDHISLSLHLAPSTRLVIATQGSTRIYRPPDPSPSDPTPSSSAAATARLTRQDIHAHIAAHAALWLAPDPCQPFAQSRYAQRQVFEIDVGGGGSLGLLDWVSEGRGARGENWAFREWKGRNEVWDVSGIEGKDEDDKMQRKKRLVLRDNLILEGHDIRVKVDGLGIFGTVILIGPLLAELARFFVEEFKALPRIGARDWSGADARGKAVMPATDAKETEAEKRERWRKRRQEREKKDGVLWTAASVRGAVVVKFGAKEVEGAKTWLGNMLREEGTVGREFGPGGLMCVK
ncbi:MAG: hypothetical protein LQ338_005923 [Usnochroma carphineum]|nr:MAG: hypothetical protein LQ338_005923 [Usnochroma carphineum]